MSLVSWRDEFSVGVAEVDHEHRELIELINQAHDALRQGRDADRIEEALGEIYARISAHFALEEKHMASQAYAQLPEHKADHERLLDEIREIIDEVADTGKLDDAQLGGRLAEWFSGHFRSHDARLHGVLR